MDANQTATVSFLRAEEIAARLAEELTRLDQESRNYSGATATLGSAGDQLMTLASAVRSNSERMADAVTAIREVGSPAIIDGLGRLDDAVKGSVAAVERAINALSGLERLGTEQTETLREMHAALSAELGVLRTELETNARELRKTINDSLEAVHAAAATEARSVRSAIDEANAAAANQVGAIRDELRVARDHQAKQSRLILIVSVFAALLAAAAVAVPLIR